MREDIREKLLEMREEKYRDFSAALIPGIKEGEMLGVRLPALRRYAKELSKGDWRKELSYKEDIYFEETMLRGMILGYACEEIDELFLYLKDFIPQIQNWSVCDSVCNGLKLVNRYPERTWEFLKPYLASKKEYEARFGLIMLLSHFVKMGEEKKVPRKRKITMEDLKKEEESGRYLEGILKVLDREFTQGYYAQMAAAWLLAELFVVYPVRTLRGLLELRLDVFTRKKAFQKIRESRIPDGEVKVYIKELADGIFI